MSRNPETFTSFGSKAAILAATGALILGACSDDDKSAELEEKILGAENAIEEMCADNGWGINQIQPNVGVGPFEPVDAVNEELVDFDEVIEEAITELAEGNGPGAALINAYNIQIGAPYNPTSVMQEAFDLYNDGQSDFKEQCVSAANVLLSKGEITTLSANEYMILQNKHDENGNWVSFEEFKVDPSAEFEVIGIRGGTENNVLAGITLTSIDGTVENARAGNFAIRVERGDGGADLTEDGTTGEELDDQTSEGDVEVTTTIGPNGEEITVTTTIGPDGEPQVTATTQGPDGETIPVNPDNGEPIPSPTAGGGGGAEGGNDDGDEDGEVTGPGTSMPGDDDNKPGGSSGKPSDEHEPSHSGPGITEGPGTTRPTPTTTGPHPTTSVRPTTTTTTKPTTTTTTTKPTTTTTTTKPTTTTTTTKPTTTTTQPPTTTLPPNGKGETTGTTLPNYDWR